MKTDQFLCGVIEGYYGRPWTTNQRKTLFEYCIRFGLNTYVYGPKDDYKHRSKWRELYVQDEIDHLIQLIQTAKRLGITFIYALSPGLDIVYSSTKDMNCLKRKLDQVIGFGCENFTLLFDDIEVEMCQIDKDYFQSFAHAHVSVTNEIYNYLQKPDLLIFCPTEYCSKMAKPTLDKSQYLQTIGNGLLPDIDIFWTGPKVVSRRIDLDHIEQVNKILKRRVIIWDNIHANDYDQRRLFLGPYSGRPCEIMSSLNGLISNPNCEFECNFIPFHTLGQWYSFYQKPTTKDNEEEVEEDNINDQEPATYEPFRALERAIVAWLPEFNRTKNAEGSSKNHLLCEPMETLSSTISTPQMSPKPALVNSEDDSQDGSQPTMSKPLKQSTQDQMECEISASIINDSLTIDDLRLLVELFYLPYEHGQIGIQLLQEFHWLKTNKQQQQQTNTRRNMAQIEEWRDRSLKFHNIRKSIGKMVQRLTTIQNRSLLYELYSYASDINSTISLCSQYLKWMDDNQKTTSVFMSGDQEPWVHRGGLSAEFLNVLPIGPYQNILREQKFLSIYTIRPVLSTDDPMLYDICTQSSFNHSYSDLLSQYPDIIADKYIGGYLMLDRGCCFVIEDQNDSICGFCVTTLDSHLFDKHLQHTYIPQMMQKYTSHQNDNSATTTTATTSITNANNDQIQKMFEPFTCPLWLYERFPARLQFYFYPQCDNVQIICQKLLKTVFESLKQRGIQGCHSILSESDYATHQLYLNVDFLNLSCMDINNQLIIVGKQL